MAIKIRKFIFKETTNCIELNSINLYITIFPESLVPNGNMKTQIFSLSSKYGAFDVCQE